MLGLPVGSGLDGMVERIMRGARGGGDRGAVEGDPFFQRQDRLRSRCAAESGWLAHDRPF